MPLKGEFPFASGVSLSGHSQVIAGFFALDRLLDHFYRSFAPASSNRDLCGSGAGGGNGRRTVTPRGHPLGRGDILCFCSGHCSLAQGHMGYPSPGCPGERDSIPVGPDENANCPNSKGQSYAF